MMPRPIHRWKSLWLGVLVLCFLVWGWAYSAGRANGFGMREGRQCVDVFAFNGSFTVIQYEDRVATPWKTWGYSQVRERWRVERPEWVFRWGDASLFYWVIFPLWVPPVGWLVAWGGWMGWRWRRERGARVVVEEMAAGE